jgi:hypothetical protein
MPAARYSAFWHRLFPIEYRLIRALDPLVAPIWRRVGLGNVIQLDVPGRRTGLPRRVLLGLLRDGDRWFLGHPNGDVAWTRNLEAAGGGIVSLRPGSSVSVRAARLPDGDLRDRAIRATDQHVFPGNLVYRLARAHIRAAGSYFLVEPEEQATGRG